MVSGIPVEMHIPCKKIKKTKSLSLHTSNLKRITIELLIPYYEIFYLNWVKLASVPPHICTSVNQQLIKYSLKVTHLHTPSGSKMFKCIGNHASVTFSPNKYLPCAFVKILISKYFYNNVKPTPNLNLKQKPF